MKPKKATDDQSTVSMRRADDVSTVAIPGGGRKKSGPAPIGDEELNLVRSYWRSGTPALKRQAISRYAQLMGLSPERAEAALAEWAHLLDQSK